MKKTIILLLMASVTFWGFKSSPNKSSARLESTPNKTFTSFKGNGSLEKLKYRYEVERAPNYITPLKMSVSDSFTSGYWPAGSVVAQSLSGEYLLQFQTDGNLVLYDLFPYVRAIWATDRMLPNPSHVWFSSYGMAASWDIYGNNIWTGDARSCNGNSATYSWILQNDGNFVCYNSACNYAMATGTSTGIVSPWWGSFNP